MPGKIQILPDNLINKIAAGEVVERPISVVKELVENSIDAGAKKIVIEIKDAGKKLIRVTDDGSGMTEEELKLALQRHSTSKIASFEDLFNISTLGFRGEALPSIASVSRLKISTKKKENDQGIELQIEGGKEQGSSLPAGKAGSKAMADGTTIIVEDLFFNVPARLKFLRTNSTETSLIADFATKIALAYPQVSFQYIQEGRTVFSTSGNGCLEDTIIDLYGADFFSQLLRLEKEKKGIKISGFVSTPLLTRQNREEEMFFVNGRYVKNPLLARSLEGAYRSLIPFNRFPVGILFLEIDPHLVDVNVHPAKREVRFSNVGELLSLTSLALQETLSKIAKEEMLKTTSAPFLKPEFSPAMFEVFNREVFSPQREFSLQPEGNKELEVLSVEPLIAICQFRETYIVATDGVDLVLIDQHAAHERILFDKLKKSKENSPLEKQTLLIAEVIEMSPAEYALAENNLAVFEGFGFELEPFGKNSFRLRALPADLLKVNAKQMMLDILADLKEEIKTLKPEEAKEKILRLIACHGAIRAGEPLELAEIRALIRDLFTTENPLTCPHGRPTIVHFSPLELEKLFKRS